MAPFPKKEGSIPSIKRCRLNISLDTRARSPDSPWRSTVIAALRKGTDRFVRTVDAAGVIDNSANTRTMACGPGVIGDEPKGREIDIVPLRLFYIGYLLDERTRLDALADQIQAIGQKLTKERKC